MRISRNLKVFSILALLAVMLSYSLDFECLLETQGCQQQVQSSHLELDSTCAQPSLMPAVVALLPTHTDLFVPLALEAPQPATLWVTLEPPTHPPLCVPLGLRAPPLSA